LLTLPETCTKACIYPYYNWKTTKKINKTPTESCYIPHTQRAQLSSSTSVKQGCTLQLNSWLKNNDHTQCTRRWFPEPCCTAFFFSQPKWNRRLKHLSQTG